MRTRIAFFVLALVSSSNVSAEQAWVWGRNDYGQFGNGQVNSSLALRPKSISSDEFMAVCCGGRVDSFSDVMTESGFTIFLKKDGGVWATGKNNHGQLGIGNKSSKSSLTRVSVLKNIASISVGGEHCLAMQTDGTVWAWGLNWAGQIGLDPEVKYDSVSPVRISSVSSVKAIYAGGDNSFFLKNDGTVWGMGNNGNGQLGIGTNSPNSNKFIPTKVIGLNNIISVSPGGYHTLALQSDGTVWSWGSSNEGRLGYANDGDVTLPRKIAGLGGICVISAGEDYSLALKNDGTVWSWGKNNFGQIGQGDNANRSKPTRIQGLQNVSYIKASTSGCSLALDKNGRLWAWGNNSKGQLGNGNTNNSNIPIQIPDLANVKWLGSGQTHLCVLTTGSSSSLSLRIVISDHSNSNGSRLIDGNQVMIKALVQNSSVNSSQISALFHDGANVSDPLLPGSPVTEQSCIIGANSQKEISFCWDTTGYAWNNNFGKQSERLVTVELLENGRSVKSETRQLEVSPRPLILVHGFLSNASVWNDYKEYTKSLNDLWGVYAVGDGRADGEMNMGHIVPPTPLTHTIEQNAQILAKYIEQVRIKTNAQHVDIVAHSMGGLVSRYYIHKLMPNSEEGDKRPVVCNLFMLGTPNLGAWESDALDGILDFLGNPARQQLSRDYITNKFNKEINNGKDVLWWGFRGNLSFPALGLGDGVVAIESARHTILDRFLNRKKDGIFEERGITHMNLNSDRGIFNDFVIAALCRGPKNQVKND